MDQAKKGILYGVGVGPGDPELLTVKAVRILREADVIAAPCTGSGAQAALGIASAYIHDKPILDCSTPMSRDRTAALAAYAGAAKRISALLEEGKTVAFLTLGDPTVYSTYFYIHRLVEERGYEARLIPGVPSFCAAAARLDMALCEGKERLLIVPAGYEDLEESLDVKANKVLMKAGRSISDLQELLRRRGELEGASLVANCGMEGEQVFPRFAEMADPTGYFSLVLVKGREQG